MNEPITDPHLLALLNWKRPIAFLRLTGSGGSGSANRTGKYVNYTFSGSITIHTPDSPFESLTAPLRDALFAHLARQPDAESGPTLKQAMDSAMAEESDTTVTVNGVEYLGRCVPSGDVRVHAATVEGGWTVVVIVPRDASPAAQIDFEPERYWTT